MSHFKIVTEHEKTTLKDLAETEGIEYSNGTGFYQLTKKETVSDSKELVWWVNNENQITDSAAIRQQLGVARSGDVTLKPADIPPGQLLFVQSTSANRKIPEDAAVLFRVSKDGEDDEDEDDDGENAGHPNKRKRVEKGEFAIKFDKLLHEIETKGGEIDDEQLQEFFNVPIATKWNECDCNVPKKLQLSSLWQLCQLSQVDWQKLDIQTHEAEDATKPKTIKFISALGTLRLLPKADEHGGGGGDEEEEEEEEDEEPGEVTVRVEFREVVKEGSPFSMPLWIYLTSIGNIWGCAHGVRSQLPFVVTNEIQQTASDDGNGFRFPIEIPSSENLTKNERFESILGNMIVNYNLACRNWN